MPRTRLVSSIVLIALTAACHESIGRSANTATEAITHAFPATPTPEVITTGFNGSIDVSPSPDGLVHATIIKKAQGVTERDARWHLKDIDVAFIVDGRTLQITARPTTKNVLVGAGADITLLVPKDASLKVTTDNGRIDTHEVGTTITARTSNGVINLVGGQAALDARTSNGSITLRPAVPVAVNARTSNGSIDFAGPLFAGFNRFETSNGSITITLPRASQFQLDASTTMGSVICAFPLTTAGQPGGHELHGRVGSDTRVQIIAHTSVGSVNVQPLQ